LFKIFLCVGRALLVHVSDAERVEAIRFGGVNVGRGLLRCWGRWGLSGARVKKSSGSEK
jgi:hypothetical protein